MFLVESSLCKGPEIRGEQHVGKMEQHLWLDYWGVVDYRGAGGGES